MSDYFSLDRITELNQIPKNSKIHIIGVCGVAMAPLAIQLSKMGYAVSGSDRQFYDPMASLLREESILLLEGYNEDHISSDTELFIISNSCRVDNPEVLAVERVGGKFSCLPKLLHDLLISGRHSVVVSGTHGKSTTSALFAYTLSSLGLNPSYFVGARFSDGRPSMSFGSGAHSVLEGDEYDSVFFAKVPKFAFYEPKTWMITSLEFDHGDIYRDLDHIIEVFEREALRVPADGQILFCSDEETLGQAIGAWKPRLACSVFSYGAKAQPDFKLLSRHQEGFEQVVLFEDRVNSVAGEFRLPLIGAHNALNALSVYGASALLKLDMKAVVASLSSFPGLFKRQQIILRHEDVVVIDDFAHHPSEVKATIRSVCEAFPDKQLIAVFEPRSNTSRSSVFQEEYSKSFEGASHVFISRPIKKEGESKAPQIDVEKIISLLVKNGVQAEIFSSTDEGVEKIANVSSDSVVLVMSNGDFQGLTGRLVERLGTI